MDQGYHTEPIWVEVSDEETVADIVTRTMGEGNYTSTGEDSGFYLASLKDQGKTEIKLPEYIAEYLKKDGQTQTVRAREGWLGQFDFYDLAGWMYFINNKMPDVGMGARVPADSDVIRVSFTVCGLCSLQSLISSRSAQW